MTATNEIVDKVASENGLTKVQAKGIVQAVFQEKCRCSML